MKFRDTFRAPFLFHGLGTRLLTELRKTEPPNAGGPVFEVAVTDVQPPQPKISNGAIAYSPASHSLSHALIAACWLAGLFAFSRLT